MPCDFGSEAQDQLDYFTKLRATQKWAPLCLNKQMIMPIKIKVALGFFFLIEYYKD